MRNDILITYEFLFLGSLRILLGILALAFGFLLLFIVLGDLCLELVLLLRL
jgi:hypothetical protein